MMNKISRFDAAALLNSPEARHEYLVAALETEDESFIRDAVALVDQLDAFDYVMREDVEVSRELAKR